MPICRDYDGNWIMTIGEMEEQEMENNYRNDLASPAQDRTVKAMLSDMNKIVIKLKDSLTEIRKAISGCDDRVLTNDIKEPIDYCMIDTVIRLREEIGSCLETSEQIRAFLW